MVKIWVVGEDKRQVVLRKLYKENLAKNIQDANIVILPTPLTKDGVNISGTDMAIENIIQELEHKTVFAGKIPKNICRQFEIHNTTYYDLMEIEELAIKNAIPTAEGTIAKILEKSNKTIFESNILVLGFGKCGKILADRLRGLKANVFCEARKDKDLAQIKAMGYNNVDIRNLEDILPAMDIVINTVPYMMLNKRRLDLLKKDAIVIDIASHPGGTDFEYCKEKGIDAVLELGIPAKTAPLSAGEYIKEVIDSKIQGGK